MGITDTTGRRHWIGAYAAVTGILLLTAACTSTTEPTAVAEPPSPPTIEAETYQRQPLTNGWTAEWYQLGEEGLAQPLIAEGLGSDYAYCVLDEVMMHYTVDDIIAMDDATADQIGIEAGVVCVEWLS